jgi:hypothetical protein
MHSYNTMGAQPGFANRIARTGAMVHAPARVGQARYYDLVGAEADPNSTWEKIKKWGDEETIGVKNKYLVLGAAVVGVAWYAYYAGWLR